MTTVFWIRTVLVLLAAGLIIAARRRPETDSDRARSSRRRWGSPATPRSLALQGLGAICLIASALLGLV